MFRSFVNIIATPKGGTHQAGFESGLVKAVRTQVEANARKLKVGQDKLEKDDVLAGMTAVLTVRLPEPQFEGQTKEILGTPAVREDRRPGRVEAHHRDPQLDAAHREGPGGRPCSRRSSPR